MKTLLIIFSLCVVINFLGLVPSVQGKRRVQCPPKENTFCYVARNFCCSDDDCNRGEICCSEYCGHTCQQPHNGPTNGERVRYDPSCTLGIQAQQRST
uniref:U6-Liphistoxin-Lm1a_1 n=1 Tax=Liphistius malayanus TaxID=1203467 RepID=A0A482ZDA9_9ARAC